MKTILAIILNLGLVTASFAVNGTLETLADETALSYSTTFDYDANAINTGRLSAQVTYTSATIAAETFTNGRVSTGTIIVLSTTSLNGTVIRVHTKDFSFGRVAAYPNATLVAVGASTEASANNLLAKIKADTTLSPLITGTSDSAQIDLESVKSDGVKYVLTTNNPTVVSVSSHTTLEGVAATVSIDDSITIAGTALSTGLKVALTGDNLPTGLSETDYYVAKINEDTIKLATSINNALAGTYVNITAVDVSTQNYTYTLTPAAITGTPGFAWQSSNDGIGWADIATSSVTMSYVAGGTHAFWDFNNYNFRWLRLNVTGPTTGGVRLKAVLNRKE